MPYFPYKPKYFIKWCKALSPFLMVPRVANDRIGFQSRYDGGIVITLKLQRNGASNKEKENRDAQSIAGARRKDKIRQGL